jgi:type III secretory pathway component EscR
MRIKTDLSHLNTLVRQLLTNSAVGFVALAVILTLMSAALQYRAVPGLMRQLSGSALGDINQISRPVSSVVAYQAPQQTAQINNQISDTKPVAVSQTAAKAFRTVKKVTQKTIRAAEANHATALDISNRNENNQPDSQENRSDKEKHDSSGRNNHNNHKD